MLALPAFAGPLDEKYAKEHVTAIAAGDIEAVMRTYANDATLDWVGGPLHGIYHGQKAIRAVWQKFAAANEGKPRTFEANAIEAYTHPQGVSFEQKAIYGGKTPVKVWHVMVYRESELSTEIWQVAPALDLSN
jgi:hypothetical protein